jgi:hypothetical protein
VTAIEFSAPWDRSLRNSTVKWLVLLAGLMFSTLGGSRWLPLWVIVLLIGVPPLILAGAIASRVRGYTLTEDAIIVHRGWGKTRLPLVGLRSVSADADAMRGWRLILFGNVGFFCLVGRFWSSKLGWYRAFATDRSRAVVLRYADRTIVISPHDPQQFIMRAGTFIKIAGFTGRSCPD